MRTRQIRLQFDNRTELERLWTTIPAEEQRTIARGYARLIIKAAKVVPQGFEPKEGTHHDE